MMDIKNFIFIFCFGKNTKTITLFRYPRYIFKCKCPKWRSPEGVRLHQSFQSHSIENKKHHGIMIESCILSHSSVYFISKTQKNNQHFRISSLFSNSFCFLEVLHANPQDCCDCNHWTNSLQRVSHFHKSAPLLWFFFWVDLAAMILKVFLPWHFLKSSCFNCQKSNLLFLTRAKVINWQLLKLDFQSFLMSWTITHTLWAMHGRTALLQLEYIKQCCLSVIRHWAKCLQKLKILNNSPSMVSQQNKNNYLLSHSRSYLEESLCPESKGSYAFSQNFVHNAATSYSFAIIFGIWAPKAC